MPEEQAEYRRPDGRFAPGVSGNPGGRPKGSVSLSAILREVLASTSEGSDKTCARGIVEATVRDALKDDGQPRKLCWAYIEGGPARSVALPGPESGPVRADTRSAAERIAAAVARYARKEPEEDGEG